MKRADYPAVRVGERNKLFFNAYCDALFTKRGVQIRYDTWTVTFIPTDTLAPEKRSLPIKANAVKSGSGFSVFARFEIEYLGLKERERYRLYPSEQYPGGWYMKRGEQDAKS